MLQCIYEPYLSRNLQINTGDAEYLIDEVQRDQVQIDDDLILQKTDEKDFYLFNNFMNDCSKIGVSHSQVLRDMGLQIPSGVFSDSALQIFNKQLHYELLDCKCPRLKIPSIFSFSHALRLFQQSKNIVFLVGAGISVNSGIPDFRSKNGIYSQLQRFNLYKPTDMFDLQFFKQNCVPFYTFAPEILPQSKYKPTFTHKFFKQLEQNGQIRRIYSQNIDCLEQQAGVSNEKIVNCHGTFATASCLVCQHSIFLQQYEQLVLNKKIPICVKCGASTDVEAVKLSDAVKNPNLVPKHVYKPDIVFFGEKYPELFLQYIDDDVQTADLFVIVGTSLKVKPIAGLLGRMPRYVPQILINRERVGSAHQFDVELIGECDQIFSIIAQQLGHQKLLDDHNRQIDDNNTFNQESYKQEFNQYLKQKQDLEKISQEIMDKEIQELNNEFISEELNQLLEQEKTLSANLKFLDEPQLRQFEHLMPENYVLKNMMVNGYFVHVHRVIDIIKNWHKGSGTKRQKKEFDKLKQQLQNESSEYSVQD